MRVCGCLNEYRRGSQFGVDLAFSTRFCLLRAVLYPLVCPRVSIITTTSTPFLLLLLFVLFPLFHALASLATPAPSIASPARGGGGGQNEKEREREKKESQIAHMGVLLCQ